MIVTLPSSTATKLSFATPPILPEVLLRGGLPRQAILLNLPWDELLEALAVDLSPYEPFFTGNLLASIGNPIQRQSSLGGLGLKVFKAMARKACKLAPEPLCLTQNLAEQTLLEASSSLALCDFQRLYASLGDTLHTLTYTGLEQSSYCTVQRLVALLETAYACTPVEHIILEVLSLPTELVLQVSLAMLKRCPKLRLTWRMKLQGFAPHHNQWLQNLSAILPESSALANPWLQAVTTIFTLRTLRKVQPQFLQASVRLGIEIETVCTPENEAFLSQWYGFVLGVLCPDDWKLALASASPSLAKTTDLHPFEATFITLARQWEADWLETSAWQALQCQERYKQAVGWEQAHWVLAVRTVRQQLEAKASLGLTAFSSSGLAKCQAGSAGSYLNASGILGGCEAFVQASADVTSTVGGYGAVQLAQFNALAIWQGSAATLMRQLSGCASLCGNCHSSQYKLLPTQWVSLNSWWQAWHIQQGLLGNTQQHQNLQATLPEFVGHA